MPLRLSKVIQRRKSSGNALEDFVGSPEPSFRVYERPTSRSFDGGNSTKRTSQGRPMSAGLLQQEHPFGKTNTSSGLGNRGSGGTNNSASSGGQYDNSSASARFSSSSTLPSSTDVPLEEKRNSNPKDAYNVPIPPIPEPNPPSRAAARSWSFGRKKAQSSAPSAAVSRFTTPQTTSIFTRERAMTESSHASESTATPPKLLDTDLDLGQSDLDGFGTMFETFGKRRSQQGAMQNGLDLEIVQSPDHMSPNMSKVPTQSYFSKRSNLTPSPIQIDRSREVELSPYSWGSHDSQDGLMQSSSPLAAENESRPGDRFYSPGYNAGLASSGMRPLSIQNSPSGPPKVRQPLAGAGTGLRRSSAYLPSRESRVLYDEDAQLVMDSLNASRKLNRQSGAFGMYRDNDDEPDTRPNPNPRTSPRPSPKTNELPKATSVESQQSPVALFESNDSDFQNIKSSIETSETTPRAKQRALPGLTDPSLFGNPPPASGSTTYRPASIPPIQPNPAFTKPRGQFKVMNSAQFNQYKREQEMSHVISTDSKSEGSDDEDNYEDDDENERNKQAIRQRRKQEAHLAVYRQQMMKMTGEQPSKLPNLGQPRPGLERTSISAPDFSGPTPNLAFTFDKAPEKDKGSDDEDEDVPLGILAAHGFPSKNRPPGGLHNPGTNPTIRYTSESYPAPPESTVGALNPGVTKGLPPFAKNLPPDPYYGAGLVNPSNREALAFGGSSRSSVHGGSFSSPHPSGLVGIIAGEERARAMRRGSPNAQGNYASPLPQMHTGMNNVMLTTPMAPPDNEAQTQMSNQMTQMMQMQMQWMQQMQQMQQMVAGGMQNMQLGQQQQPFAVQQQMMNNGFLSPPGPTPGIAPMGSYSAPQTPGLGDASQPRAMSMISPSTGQQWAAKGNVRLTAPSVMTGALGNQGYTPSIAPSERSNVGMPSRYRPVSIAPTDEVLRPTSRMSTFTSGRFPAQPDRRSGISPTIGPVQPSKQPSRRQNRSTSDDDDDEGWEEMRSKREQVKQSRKSKKIDGPDLRDIYPSEI